MYPATVRRLRSLGTAGPAIRALRHSGEDATRHATARAIARYRQPDGSDVLANEFRYIAASA